MPSLALTLVAVWALLGHLFHHSEGWQLVVNTGTIIVTFLMVFVIQQSQNKDSVALHLKLNEVLAASKQASNRMTGIENLDEQDLRDVASFYVRLAERAKSGNHGKETHSIDEEGRPTDQPQRSPQLHHEVTCHERMEFPGRDDMRRQPCRGTSEPALPMIRAALC